MVEKMIQFRKQYDILAPSSCYLFPSFRKAIPNAAYIINEKHQILAALDAAGSRKCLCHMDANPTNFIDLESEGTKRTEISDGSTRAEHPCC